jgi:hypothetical protein
MEPRAVTRSILSFRSATVSEYAADTLQTQRKGAMRYRGVRVREPRNHQDPSRSPGPPRGLVRAMRAAVWSSPSPVILPTWACAPLVVLIVIVSGMAEKFVRVTLIIQERIEWKVLSLRPGRLPRNSPPLPEAGYLEKMCIHTLGFHARCWVLCVRRKRIDAPGHDWRHLWASARWCPGQAFFHHICCRSRNVWLASGRCSRTRCRSSTGRRPSRGGTRWDRLGARQLAAMTQENSTSGIPSSCARSRVRSGIDECVCR